MNTINRGPAPIAHILGCISLVVMIAISALAQAATGSLRIRVLDVAGEVVLLTAAAPVTSVAKFAEDVHKRGGPSDEAGCVTR